MAIFRVSIYGTIFGAMTCNVLHFSKDAAVTADATTLAQKVRDLWVHNPISLNCDSCAFWNRIHVKQLGSTDPPVDLTITEQGTWAASNNNTGPVCAVFQIRTGVGGRRGRGRFYVSGIGLGTILSGVWEPTTQNRLNNVALNLKLHFITGTPPTVFFLGVAPRNDPASFIFATDVVARGLVGFQRRRNIGVGA